MQAVGRGALVCAENIDVMMDMCFSHNSKIRELKLRLNALRTQTLD